MPSTIIAGAEHPKDLLALYVHSGEGRLVDADEAKFAVFNATSGYPGTQVFPVSGYEDVTDTDGHVSTGYYAAYDGDAPWAPATTYARAYVKWVYTVDGEERTAIRHFESVATTVTTSPGPALALIQDVRDVNALSAYTDKSVLVSLRWWRATVERYCNQRLWPAYETRRITARTGGTLFLPERCLVADVLDADAISYDLTRVQVYIERENPKVVFGTGGAFGVVSKTTYWVKGAWGYFDLDTGDVFQELTDEVAKTVADVLLHDGAPSSMGVVRREKTDGHEIEFSVVGGTVRLGFLALLKSPVMRDMLSMMSAPRAIARVV